MTNATYYLDTCIWLNLFKKEEGPNKKIEYWKITKDFMEKTEISGNKIIVSTIVLKELSFTIKNHFKEIKMLFRNNHNIQIIKTKDSDYSLARELEKKDNFNLSFYDYLHIAIAKRLNMILITRDKKLIEFSKDIINVSKPEDLIS